MNLNDENKAVNEKKSTDLQEFFKKPNGDKHLHFLDYNQKKEEEDDDIESDDKEFSSSPKKHSF